MIKIIIVQPFALGPGHYSEDTRKLCKELCFEGVSVTLFTAAGTESGWELQMPLRHIAAMDSASWLLADKQGFRQIWFLKYLRMFWTSWRVCRAAFKTFSGGCYKALHFIDIEPLALFINFFLFKKPKNVFITTITSYKFPKESFWLSRYVYDPLRRAALRKLFKYVKPITHSRYIRDSLIELMPDKSVNLPVIPLGIEGDLVVFTKEEARKRLGILDSLIIFGFLGHLRNHKGFDLVLESWGLLPKNFYLLVAVDCNVQEEKSIMDKISKLGIQDRIFLHFGHANREIMKLNICACDAVLLPYKKYFIDESSLLTEALANRVPVIVSDVGIIGEIVKDNGLGVIFEPDSSVAFREAINKFYSLKDEQVTEIKNNVNLFVKSRDWNKVARLHLDVYQNISLSREIK